MGTKFCNLNIRSSEPDKVKAVISQFDVFSCAPGWITVVSNAFQWGSTQKYAKQLSQSLGVPVLSTEYFDDDYVEFALYDCGKLVTRHVPVSYEALPKKKGNAAKLIEALQLNKVDEPVLKKVLTVTDCEQSVCLMESLLGCPIFSVKEDSPPLGIPDRAVVDSFAGGKSDVHVVIRKNPAKNDYPPYVTGPEKHPADRDFLLSTILCFTDHPERIIKKVELWLKRLREDREQHFLSFDYFDIPDPPPKSDPLEEFDVRILCGERTVAVQGMFFDASHAAELSREMKCLVAVCLLGANGLFRGLDCSFGYANRQLCYGRRGTDAGTGAVIPDMELESPFLTLAPGALVRAFETPDFEDAVTAMEKLLCAPLRPISFQDYLLSRESDHLRVYGPHNPPGSEGGRIGI